MELTLDSVLDAGGFSGAGGLVRAAGTTGSATADGGDACGSLLDAKDGIDALYQLDHVPQVYFKYLRTPQSRDIQRIHRTAWNRGDAPILFAVSPTEIRLYNLYARPDAHTGPDFDQRCLLHKVTNAHTKLQQIANAFGRGAFDTGSFWRCEEVADISVAERVDLQLLRDVEATTKHLQGGAAGLQPDVAQALVGRAIFLSYLMDRQHKCAREAADRFGFATLAEAFDDPRRALSVLEWTQQAFNGDVFPLTSDHLMTVRAEHCETIARFLSGDDMSTGQGRLWPYDFSEIPIELISSIYEMFAHQGDPSAATQHGIHYTPHLVARLVLGRAMEDLGPDARILDPACGSGIFMVEAFKRLARKLEQQQGRPPTRQELERILLSQLYGIELSREAARVAAFSLYLALLELDPESAVTDRQPLPHLFGKSLFAPVDAFDVQRLSGELAFPSGHFDLVVGNPPWTAWEGSAPTMGEEYCKDRQLPIGGRAPYHAFLWRSAELAGSEGKIAMLVNARMLFGPTAAKAREHLLSAHTVHDVVNLMDLRKTPVFPKVDAPPAAIFFDNHPPNAETSLAYHCPKWDRRAAKTGHAIVLEDDVVCLPVKALQEAPRLWKTAFWGAAADDALLGRMEEYDTLGAHIARAGWVGRKGPTLTSEGGYPMPTRLESLPHLRARDATRYGVDLSKLRPLAERAIYWHRRTDASVFAGTQLLLASAARGQGPLSVFTTRPVMYDQRFYGYAVHTGESELARYLSMVINSDIAAYYTFLSCAGWGVERDDVSHNDLCSLPVPAWEEIGTRTRRAILDTEKSLRELAEGTARGATAELQRRANALMETAYGFSAQDRDLLHDTLLASLSFFQKRDSSLAAMPASEDDLTRYARVLLSALAPYIEAVGQHVAATVWLCVGSDVQAVEVSQVPDAPLTDVVVRTASGITEALHRVSKALTSEMNARLGVRRSLRVYDGQDVLLIKYSQKRFWTRSAARADAGEILADHMRGA